jgi:Phage integrase family
LYTGEPFCNSQGDGSLCIVVNSMTPSRLKLHRFFPSIVPVLIFCQCQVARGPSTSGKTFFRGGQITVQAVHAKSGESRTVPMNTVLKETLTRLRGRSDGSGCFFVSRSGQPFRSIRTQFTTACRNAKLADVTPHTLRHTFASRLAIAGIGLRTIQELGGRKEIRMVLRYADLSDQHRADAVETITGKIAEDSTTLITTAKSNCA